MIESFATISGPSEGIYKEKGSKFLAFAFPVESEESVREQLAMLRKRFFDARHHCYAYILHPDKSQVRANDDGEPGHSAGDPILGQIRSRELTNVLVVVVRYFGGTKLGVGGLISAYKTAASLALDNAAVQVREVQESFMLNYDYGETTDVMRLLKEIKGEILDQEFGERCRVFFKVSVGQVAALRSRIKILQDMGFSISY